MEEELKISKVYFKEIVDFNARSLVGKCLKRLEIIENRDILKKSIKELIYEHSRSFSDLFMAYQKGRELQQFNFNHKRD